jgi:exodeoxyribonuclease V alpha subunit
MVEGTPGSAFEDEVEIRRVRFAAAETGFAVVEAVRDGDEVILVGSLAHLEAGERVAISGRWQDDKRFGMQVRTDRAEPRGPSGPKALILYLERVKGVGPTRAARLYQRYGEDVLDAVDADPRRVFKDAGLGARQAAAAAASWDGLRSTRQLHLLLAPHGLAWLVPRIDKEYGPRAYRVVRDEPYELTSVFGVGFPTADRIARAAGIAADAPAREAAALLHVLAEAERDGSTCLPVGEAARRTGELLRRDPPGAALLRDLVDRGRLTVEIAPERSGDEASGRGRTTAWAYRPPTARLEQELARRIHALATKEPSAKLRAPDAPAPDEHAHVPAEAQWQAVEHAFAHRLSIVTGGPGTGKTATIRMLCAAAHAQEATVVLVAPTGRAARRVSESTGLEASTVHSALQWIPGEGPQRGSEDPLRGDLLVVDETSMANLELLVTLLRAVGPRMHVVLVGDADQLAPVGAGKPFAELVGSGLVPTSALTHIFRQAAGSMIVRGAHEVRRGRAPSFAPAEDTRRDLFLIERDDPAAALDEIVSLVATRLPAHYGVDPIEDVQVFAPVYRGPLGIDALNERLREALNPRGAKVLGGRLRLGDKLMLSGRNLHDLGLMNGTILRLLAVGDDAITVSADGVTVELPEEEAGRLQPAYACSVHKGQGIELPVAVLVAHPSAGARFLRREMLYTAMTRARVATVIVGRREVVAAAAARADTASRRSRLVDRLTSAAAPAG